MVAEFVTIGVLVLGGIAEVLHAKRCRRLAPLAFGPSRRPRLWVMTTPFLRVAALGLLCWGLITLLIAPPKVYQPEGIAEEDMRHVLLVLDVSPSMKLEDAGPELNKSRARRVAEVMESFFKRVVMERVRLSVVAVYNGAIPVVVDTRDVEVVRNILNDLPLHHAFDVGRTRIFDGLEEAARIARPWKLNSTTVVLISDGDTVPATGMPQMPPSVADVLIIGVGDPKTGRFIDGRQSRQDTATLRQIAHRLRGVYHDGNQKHVSSELLTELTSVEVEDPFGGLTRREFALIAVGLGSGLLALLPLALAAFGVGWRPGVKPEIRRIPDPHVV